MIKPAIERIKMAGAVVFSTFSSFVAPLPEIYPTSNPVKWGNVCVFISGVLVSVICSKANLKKKSYSLVVVLLLLLVSVITIYGILETRYSVKCGSDWVIVADEPVRPELQGNWNWWLTHGYSRHEDISERLLKGCKCEPTCIWSSKDLYPRYLTLLFLYLVAVTVLTVIVASLPATKRRNLAVGK